MAGYVVMFTLGALFGVLVLGMFGWYRDGDDGGAGGFGGGAPLGGAA